VPTIAPEVLGAGSTYKKSIPACSSAGCKTASETTNWTNMPGDAPYVYGPDLIYSLNERRSVPACDSTGCKKGSVIDSWDVPTSYNDVRGVPTHVYALNEYRSIPACNSYGGCKTASASSGWNVPSMSPEVYGNNGEYTYATNDHK
jgi:hypothetical protein